MNFKKNMEIKTGDLGDDNDRDVYREKTERLLEVIKPNPKKTQKEESTRKLEKISHKKPLKLNIKKIVLLTRFMLFQNQTSCYNWK